MLSADFVTFQNYVENKFGTEFCNQADLFFERAINEAKKGLIESAIRDGKFASDLINYSNDKTGFLCILGFLSQLHCEKGNIKISKSYYNLGVKLLDVESEDYDDDFEMFRRLKEDIDSEDWKEGLE